jgi:peptidylprolyl isomerase
MTTLIKIDTQLGEGAEAQAGQTVIVHYTGWLFDESAPDNKGAKFDSSLDRNDPFDFPLGAGHVIQGWDVGVQGMKVGGHRTLIIPSEMGYGARGAGDDIPPHAKLVFDVKLLNVIMTEIIDTKIGEGEEAQAGQQVTVHYTGWLFDKNAADNKGTKFDSSRDRNDPFDFPLGASRVIQGWDIGVQGMKVGGQRTLVIPPEMGYGKRGAGGVIPPNATLLFEVELLAIN